MIFNFNKMKFQDKKKLYDEFSKPEDIEKAKREKEAVANSILCNKKYPIEPQAAIDLHGKGMQNAIKKIDEFVQNSTQQKIKFVRIITGIGNNSKDKNPILFPAAFKKLSELKKCGRIRNFKEVKSSGGFDVYLI